MTEGEQLQIVCEFFQHVVSRPTSEDKTNGLEVMVTGTVRSPGMMIPSGHTVEPGPEELWFGTQTPFPTLRRPQRRLWDISFTVGAEHEFWATTLGIQVGPSLSHEERSQVLRLLWIWRDLFVERMEDLPVTDLVVHTIPTYPWSKPYRARDPIYAMDEIRWQKIVLPTMIGNIVERGSSPWVAKTTWVNKKDTTVSEAGRWPLRMVHTYCQLNDATIKTNYPMKRMEPILGDLANPQHRYYFSVDAAHGFYAVPIYPPHAYKTAFNTILGQFYYLRMPMGLTGAPATYARLKDLTFGPIPKPCPEPAMISILDKHPGVSFRYFVDDDYGAAHTFNGLLDFLHWEYFPRICWARLTLKPSKSRFFMSTIEPLGMLVGSHEVGSPPMVKHGLRANDAKRGKIGGYPIPTCEEEVEAFLHLTTYLKTLIPDRVELSNVMKGAVLRVPVEKKEGSQVKGSKKKGPIVGFQWGEAQQKAFDTLKLAIEENVVVGGDVTRRFYVSMTTSTQSFGAVFFQLTREDEEEVERSGSKYPRGKERVVQFISQNFADPETRYPILEREYLAALRTLEEVRYHVLQSPFPVVLYVSPLLNGLLRRKEDLVGRLASWQTRMGEFRLESRPLKIKDMSLALAQRGAFGAWSMEREWEDVRMVETTPVTERVYSPGRVVYDPQLQILTDGEAVVIFVDGACRGNGTDNVRASIGVYAGPNHPINMGRMLTDEARLGSRRDKLTNQVAELQAAIQGVTRGIELTRKVGRQRLVVASDSAYVCEGITTWIYKWRQGNYVGIHNRRLFKILDELVEQAGVDNPKVVVQFWKIDREENREADELARRTLELDSIAEEKKRRHWYSWLEDTWYGDVVSYLLFERSLQLGETRQRKVRRDARKYMLVENEDSAPRLVYRETDGSLARCVRHNEVSIILHRFHDNHGHFAAGIVARNLIGRYYWPGRLQDVAKWCLSCEACQRIGPRKNSSQVKPITSLQPMDLMGMDFVGPITPNSVNGSVYILLAVDYFSRFLFAHATERNTGEAVVTFLENCIVKTFGWPLAFYVDNGSHFVKGKLPGRLKDVGTLLFTAPITNPRSVGLSERYVQLVLAGLRARIAADVFPKAMERWDEHLDHVVQAINTRVLRVHGYTPSQLFLGFNVRFHPLDRTVVEDLRQKRLHESRATRDGGFEIADREYDLRLAQLEEVRELTRERVMRCQEEMEAGAPIPRFRAPQLGDLVLRRRFNVDKSLGMKLHTKWDGPYRLSRISASGVSGDLTDLKTDRFVGRYAFESLKVFVSRDENKESRTEKVAWVTLGEGLKDEEVNNGAVVL